MCKGEGGRRRWKGGPWERGAFATVEKYTFKLLLKAFNYCFNSILKRDGQFCSPIELDFNCIHFFVKLTYSDCGYVTWPTTCFLAGKRQ